MDLRCKFWPTRPQAHPLPIHPTRPTPHAHASAIAHGSLWSRTTCVRPWTLSKCFHLAYIMHSVSFHIPIRSRPQRLQRPVKVARARCPRERGCKIVQAVLQTSEVADQVQQNTVFFSTCIKANGLWASLSTMWQDLNSFRFQDGHLGSVSVPLNHTLNLRFAKIHCTG